LIAAFDGFAHLEEVPAPHMGLYGIRELHSHQGWEVLADRVISKIDKIIKEIVHKAQENEG
jgi:hypothetical protein